MTDNSNDDNASDPKPENQDTINKNIFSKLNDLTTIVQTSAKIQVDNYSHLNKIITDLVSLSTLHNESIESIKKKVSLQDNLGRLVMMLFTIIVSVSFTILRKIFFGH